MKTSKDRRRWCQFSFKFLLVLITVAALLCLFWREHTLRIEAEKQAQQNAALHRKTTARLQDLELRHELTTLQLQNKRLREEMERLRAETAAIGRSQPMGDVAVFRHHPSLSKDRDGAAQDAELVYVKAREHRLNGAIEGGLGRGQDFWIRRTDLPIWEAIVEELKQEGSLTHYVPGEVDVSGCGFLPTKEIPPPIPKTNLDQN